MASRNDKQILSQSPHCELHNGSSETYSMCDNMETMSMFNQPVAWVLKVPAGHLPPSGTFLCDTQTQNKMHAYILVDFNYCLSKNSKNNYSFLAIIWCCANTRLLNQSVSRIIVCTSIQGYIAISN